MLTLFWISFVIISFLSFSFEKVIAQKEPKGTGENESKYENLRPVLYNDIFNFFPKSIVQLNHLTKRINFRVMIMSEIQERFLCSWAFVLNCRFVCSQVNECWISTNAEILTQIWGWCAVYNSNLDPLC